MKLGQRLLVLGRLVDEPAGAESSGLKYLVASAASSPLPSNWVLKPLMMPWRSLRASGSSVLKSWSRSTAVVVDAVSSVRLVGERRLASGPGLSAT